MVIGSVENIFRGVLIEIFNCINRCNVIVKVLAYCFESSNLILILREGSVKPIRGGNKNVINIDARKRVRNRIDNLCVCLCALIGQRLRMNYPASAADNIFVNVLNIVLCKSVIIADISIVHEHAVGAE